MKLSIKDTVVLGMMGPLLFVVGDLAFEMLPNIHLVGVLLVVITAVYRKWALVPLYLYVLLNGLWGGFSLWWVPYLYIWTILWGAVMCVPRRLPLKWQAGLCIGLCAAHGYLYGVLYAPAQALLFGLSFDATIAWIVAGLPFDLIHGTSNLIAGCVLVYPLLWLLRRLQSLRHI